MDKKELRIGFLTAHYTSLVPVASASFNGGDVITSPNSLTVVEKTLAYNSHKPKKD